MEQQYDDSRHAKLWDGVEESDAHQLKDSNSKFVRIRGLEVHYKVPSGRRRVVDAKVQSLETDNLWLKAESLFYNVQSVGL